MDVVALSRLPVGSIQWQPRAGATVLTFVCKATYALQPGECVLAPEQQGLNERDRYWGDDSSRSLYAPSDLVPVKPYADVVLVGHAFAPGRQPTRSVVARLRVGEMEKAMVVWCDRTLFRGAVQEGAPFLRMPLAWERSAGGPETVNPVGIRAGERDAHGAVTLPNLVPEGAAIDAFEPCGFGSIAPGWPSRREKLGRHAESTTDWHLWTLPEGVDLAYFNAAPPNQQVQSLPDDVVIVLENLLPDQPRLVTRLPGLHPRVFLEGREQPQSLAMRCDTLWIDTDRACCTMTWRGQMLTHPTEVGRVLVALELPGQTLTWNDVERLGRGASAAPSPSPSTPGKPKGAAVVVASQSTPLEDEDIPAEPRRAQTLPFASDSDAAPSSGLPFRASAPPSGLASLPAPVPSLATPQAPGPGPTIGAVMAGAVAPVSRAAALPPPTRAPARAEPRDAVQLLWFEPRSVPRIRRVPRWREALDTRELAPSDADLDAPAFADEAAEIEDRREIGDILTRCASADAEAIHEALSDAVRDDGSFAPSLALCAGELQLPFDEQETLRATVATATPLAGGDERLDAAVRAARDFLKAEDTLCPAGVFEGFTLRIRDAFTQMKRPGSVGSLEPQIERVLLERRRYQRRAVFGASHLRALLVPAGATAPVAAYLPDELSAKLPMYQRFRVRLIAEVCFRADQYEAAQVALRVVALGWAVPAPRR